MPIPRVQVYSAIEDTSGVLSVVAVLFDSATVCPGYLAGFLERSVLAVCLALSVFNPLGYFRGRVRVATRSLARQATDFLMPILRSLLQTATRIKFTEAAARSAPQDDYPPPPKLSAVCAARYLFGLLSLVPLGWTNLPAWTKQSVTYAAPTGIHNIWYAPLSCKLRTLTSKWISSETPASFRKAYRQLHYFRLRREQTPKRQGRPYSMSG